MKNISIRYPKYFEVTYKNTIAGYTCSSWGAYIGKLGFLSKTYPDLELVYREWNDGSVEDGVIERNDWGRR